MWPKNTPKEPKICKYQKTNTRKIAYKKRSYIKSEGENDLMNLREKWKETRWPEASMAAKPKALLGCSVVCVFAIGLRKQGVRVMVVVSQGSSHL